MKLAQEVRVTGRVQGVGYRAWTRDRALAHGLCGWVRNEPDGSVRAVLSGAPEAVAVMLEDMKSGPPLARVARVDVTETEAEAKPGFEVRR